MKVEITRLDELPPNQGVRVKVGDHVIAMFRIEDDVYAIGDRCSHAEASLAEGELWDTSVECPRHGSEFDLKTGEPQALPATVPVPVYEVSVEDGTVYLELEDV
ncbi:MAG TPA: non-heme iron oxygenase ferredoxin subunit [Acidimicrobiia bacterium]|jgi:3-phenylpropionate/trans-cinnamate dioxygenase ferredoxin subunit|nr:non-heme iron oxygenase ferredoxin subunit [Acidimicrobiia bacterium]